MMKRRKIRGPILWVDTGGRPSNSAKALASMPGFRRNRTSKFIRAGDVIINWGSTKGFEHGLFQVLNYSDLVASAVNKLSAFRQLEEDNVPIPQYTTSKEEAVGWNRTFFARTKLTGHSGEGIIEVPKGTPLADVPDAPLYVLYIYKVREFRVHVVCGAVIDVQQKIRDPEREPKTWKIRSRDNGFIFAREGVEFNPDRDRIAIEAVDAFSLDFGAVDLIEDKEGNFYVLEVNTAPGLEGQTINSYARAFREYQM